jgi:hypothetical protein
MGSVGCFAQFFPSLRFSPLPASGSNARRFLCIVRFPNLLRDTWLEQCMEASQFPSLKDIYIHFSTTAENKHYILLHFAIMEPMAAFRTLREQAVEDYFTTTKRTYKKKERSSTSETPKLCVHK